MRTLALCVASLVAASSSVRSHEHLTRIAADTIDVPVGSPLVNGDAMTAFVTHLVVDRTTSQGTMRMQEATNTISFADSGGMAITHVNSAGSARGPNGQVSWTTDFAFNRHTLALMSVRNAGPQGTNVIRTDALPLTAPAFYSQWSDYIVEELPKRMGASYRLRLWRPMPSAPGGTPAVHEETHVYTVAARESVVSLGKTYPNAWVVEDRDASGALQGRMYIIDEPPKLVRWTMIQPDGTVQIDQELVQK